MDIRFIRKLNKAKKNLVNAWYKAMKPLADYLDKRETKKYKSIKDTITEDEVVKLTVKGISKKMAKQSYSMELIVAKYINTEDAGGTSFSDLYWSIKKRKTKIGFNKYQTSVDFQLKVIGELSKVKGLSVELTDWKPSTWVHTEDFRGLYKIKIVD